MPIETKSDLDHQLIVQLSGGPEQVDQVIVPIVQSLLAADRLKDFVPSLKAAIDARDRELFKTSQQHYAVQLRVFISVCVCVRRSIAPLCPNMKSSSEI